MTEDRLEGDEQKDIPGSQQKGKRKRNKSSCYVSFVLYGREANKGQRNENKKW